MNKLRNSFEPKIKNAISDLDKKIKEFETKHPNSPDIDKMKQSLQAMLSKDYQDMAIENFTEKSYSFAISQVEDNE
jgi:hypothetical protein